MKYLFIAIAMLLFINVNAQSINIDTLFLKSGDIILGKIVATDKFDVVIEQLGSKKSLNVQKSVIERISTNNKVDFDSKKKLTFKDAGDELVSASNLLGGGTIVSIIGIGITGGSIFVDNTDTRTILLAAGIGGSFIGLMCTVAGFTKIGSAGKVLQNVKLGDQARLDVNYYGLSASVRVRF